MQRLCAFIPEQIEKFARFRGVLAVKPSRIRTGDGGFGPSKTQQPAFFSVGKSGGSDSLQIRLGVLRLRILLTPPTSLGLQRLPALSPAPPRKSPRFRGVLAVKPSRIRTGDREFQADKASRLAFISVANFGGSDSRQIRLGVLRVRILLAPPTSLGLQRLFPRTWRQPENFPRFRGV